MGGSILVRVGTAFLALQIRRLRMDDADKVSRAAGADCSAFTVGCFGQRFGLPLRRKVTDGCCGTLAVCNRGRFVRFVLFAGANCGTFALCNPVVVGILVTISSWIAGGARTCSNKRVREFGSSRTDSLHNASSFPVAIGVSKGACRAAGARSGCYLAVRADELPFRTRGLRVARRVTVRRCSLEGIVPTDGTRPGCGLAVAGDCVPCIASCLRTACRRSVRCLRLECVCIAGRTRAACCCGCSTDFLPGSTRWLRSATGGAMIVTVDVRVFRTRCAHPQRCFRVCSNLKAGVAGLLSNALFAAVRRC